MNITAKDICLSLLPFAADEMKRAEQMFAKGEDKLNAVLDHVRNVYEATSGPAAFGIAFNDFRDNLVRWVNGRVEHFHADGEFTKQQMLAA